MYFSLCKKHVDPMGKIDYWSQSSVVFIEPEWVNVSLPYSSPVCVPFSRPYLNGGDVFLVLTMTLYRAQPVNFVSFKKREMYL